MVEFKAICVPQPRESRWLQRTSGNFWLGSPVSDARLPILQWHGSPAVRGHSFIAPFSDTPTTMTTFDHGRSPEYWMLALDIASRRCVFHSPDELATDVWCWMEAHDFDVAFVGEDRDQIVRRESLNGCDDSAKLEEFVEQLPADRRFPASLSMSDAFSNLLDLGWIVLEEEGEIIGIVTLDDVGKPAVGAFVLGHLIMLERTLRRLCATYSNAPMPDEPPNVKDCESLLEKLKAEGLSAEVTYLSKAVNRSQKLGALRKDLGYSRSQFEKATSAAVMIRNDLAHSRGLSYGNRNPAEAIQRFLRVQELLQRANDLLTERPQIWDVIASSEIVMSENGDVLAGENAVPLPVDAPCHVINAANPNEEGLGNTKNERRNELLRQVLGRQAQNVVEVVGRSPCGGWSEKSFLVNGIPESSLLDLARQYGQRAVFKLTEEEKLVVAIDGSVRSRTSRVILTSKKVVTNGSATAVTTA